MFTAAHRTTRFALFALVLATLAFASSSTLAQDSAPATPEAVAPQLPATVTDVDGNEVTIADVGRIVALSGDVAEIVWTLGLGANIVGVDPR